MSYFSKYPQITFEVDGWRKKVVDILTTVHPQRTKINSKYIFQNLIVASGDRPESIAWKLYRRADLHWVLLVINDIVNPYRDWPMSDDEVEDYVAAVYGDVYKVLHFIDTRTERQVDDVDDAYYRGLTVLPQYIKPITALEHERELNMERRNMIAVNPKYINQFVETWRKEIAPKT